MEEGHSLSLPGAHRVISRPLSHVKLPSEPHLRRRSMLHVSSVGKVMRLLRQFSFAVFVRRNAV